MPSVYVYVNVVYLTTRNARFCTPHEGWANSKCLWIWQTP